MTKADATPPSRRIEPRRVRRVAVMVSAVVAPRRLMLEGIARFTQEHEPWAISLPLLGAASSLERWLDTWQGDGIIGVSEPIGPAAIKLIRRRRIPVVDVVGLFAHERIPVVRANDRSVGRLGAEHLLERGFRHFGFCEFEDKPWSARRREGFCDALAPHGLGCAIHVGPAPAWELHEPAEWERRQETLVRWLRALPKPCGVMTTSDLMGQQLLELCLRTGVRVPDELAVVGADNDEPICRVSYPQLSSVAINDRQRGYVAASLLERMMDGERPARDPGQTLVEPVGVVTRASSDIMAVSDPSLVLALRFLREHVGEPIAVDDVVDVTPLSRTSLEQRFRRTLGRSINGELTRLRLAQAIGLLGETTLELKAVARKAGFGSQSYMNAVFRAKLGKTPGSFRGIGKVPAILPDARTVHGEDATPRPTGRVAGGGGRA